MVKLLDGTTEAHGLDDQKPLSRYDFHEEHGLKNSSNVFPLFQDCYKSITVGPVSKMKL